MSVLVLHRGPLADSPYPRWLAGHHGGIVLLASHEGRGGEAGVISTDDPAYRHVEMVEGYDVGGYVEPRALELARRHRVGHIVATQERDLERAAQLREVLGLPGQGTASAAAFRDKVAMKRAVRDRGIPVAPWAEVENAVDVLAFAGQHGFPLVLKPRNGGGSVDLRIVHDAGELDTLLTTGSLTGEGLPNLIVEAFVPGPMGHVDGLVVDGEVRLAWPSQYQYALASYRTDRRGRLDVTLDRDDPLTARLLAFTDEVLAALPTPRHCAFHAEVFHTPDDRLVLCEIACRTGGASIRTIMGTLFGVDPTECWIRAQVGLPVPAGAAGGRPEPAGMAGQLALMKRPGRVVRVSGSPPFPWVVKSRVLVRPGEVMTGASSSGDFLAAFVATAPTRARCEQRLHELDDWFQDGLTIEEDP